MDRKRGVDVAVLEQAERAGELRVGNEDVTAAAADLVGRDAAGRIAIDACYSLMRAEEQEVAPYSSPRHAAHIDRRSRPIEPSIVVIEHLPDRRKSFPGDQARLPIGDEEQIRAVARQFEANRAGTIAQRLALRSALEDQCVAGVHWTMRTGVDCRCARGDR